MKYGMMGGFETPESAVMSALMSVGASQFVVIEKNGEYGWVSPPENASKVLEQGAKVVGTGG